MNVGILYEKYAEPLLKHCIYLTRKKPIEADDLSQETWIKICNNIQYYDKSKPFLAWARTIATRVMIDMQRKNERRPYLCAEIWDRPDPKTKSMYNKMEDLLASLTKEEKDIISKIYVEGYDMTELADEKKVSAESLWKRVSRIRNKLRENINDENNQ